MGRAADRLDRLFDHLVLDDQLELYLGEKVDDVLGAAVELGMALLAAETLGLEHGNALEADLVEGVLHLIELEGLDDRFDLLHWLGPPRTQTPVPPVAAVRLNPKEAEFMPDLST